FSTCRSVIIECCTSSFCSCRKWKDTELTKNDTCRRSNCTRPSMLRTLFSLLPICLL
ncbi:hypothetical protein EGW08_000267, partial [Elysia chlorotica]